MHLKQTSFRNINSKEVKIALSEYFVKNNLHNHIESLGARQSLVGVYVSTISERNFIFG